MNTIQCWITREPKGEDEDEYMLHFTHPELKCWDGEEDNKHVPYWYSGYDSVNLIAQDSYGLNPGECMEWVMVKSDEMNKLIEYNAQLMEEIRKLRAANITVVQNINNNKKPKSQINITNIEDTYSL